MDDGRPEIGDSAEPKISDYDRLKEELIKKYLELKKKYQREMKDNPIGSEDFGQYFIADQAYVAAKRELQECIIKGPTGEIELPEIPIVEKANFNYFKRYFICLFSSFLWIIGAGITAYVALGQFVGMRL